MIDQAPNTSAPVSPAGGKDLKISGATVTPLYVQRQMKVYAIHEYEIHSLSMLNTNAGIFFALASFVASAALSIWINAFFYTQLTPVAFIAAAYVAPGLLVLSIIFLIVAVLSIRKGQSTWKSIKEQSRLP